MRPTESPLVSRPIDATTPGRGLVAIDCVAGRSAVTRLRASSPLKLLTPSRPCSRAAWVIAASYGGGLLAGDDLRLSVRVGPGAAMMLGTQASTKIYRADPRRGCSQRLALAGQADSISVVAPDPVTPFEGAVYAQHQRFDLAATATLIYVDWVTSGRCARGERWKFRRYESRSDVAIEGRVVLRDGLVLDSADGRLDAPCRTGGFHCFATLVLIGPAVQTAAALLVAQIDRTPLRRGSPILFSASPLGTGHGAIFRIAGCGPETVGRWLRERLGVATELLGNDPWLRKY